METDFNPTVRYAMKSHLNDCEKSVRVYDSRIFLCVDGSMEIFIENKHYLLNKNSIFFCCGGSRYKIRINDFASIYAVNFDMNSNDKTALEPKNPVGEQELFFQEKVNSYSIFKSSHFCINNASELEPSVKLLCDEMLYCNRLYLEKCSGIMKKLLCDIYRKLNGNDINNERNADAICIAKAFIEENFCESISNKLLADMTGYHEYHLERIFNARVGMSIHQYVLSQRIAASKRLLISTDFSIQDIAYKCGFNSNTYFSSYFKKQSGISPFEFRIRYKNMI